MSKNMENKKYDITDEQLSAWLDENLSEEEDAMVTEALENDPYLREIVEASLDVEDKLFVDRLRDIYRGNRGEDDGNTEGGGLHPVPLFGANASRYDWGTRLLQLKQNGMKEGQDEDYGRRAANSDEERKSGSKSSSEGQSSSGVLALCIFLALLAVLVIGYFMYNGIAEENQRKDEAFENLMDMRSSHDVLKSYNINYPDIPIAHSARHSGQMLFPKDDCVNHNRAEDFRFAWESDYAVIIDVMLDGEQLVLKTLDSKTNSYTIPVSQIRRGKTMQWKITFKDPERENSFEGMVMLYEDVY